MPGSLRNSGIAPLGAIPWGTHFCLFYETDADLTDVTVSYLAAGLEQNELCFWMVASPLTPQTAKDALRGGAFDCLKHPGHVPLRAIAE